MSPQEPLTVKGMLGVLNACCVTLKVAATSTHTHKVVSILNNKTDLCTLRILPYLVRNSTQNTEIRICYFGYGNAHLLNTETLMVT